MSENVLVITGASAGIGLATARLFCAANWRVINLSRRPCPLADVDHLGCDLSDPSARQIAVKQLARRFDAPCRLVLIHNAAMLHKDNASSTEADVLRQILEVNLVAVNALNRRLIPSMAPGSAIAYLGSTLSTKAVPGTYSYVLSKHAIIGMMRATCQDLAGTGIHTVCVCPGFTDTEMLKVHVPVEARQAVAAMSAFGRLIQPREIAECLLWAAREPCLNGAVLHAGLGQMAHY
ncbi:MAG TPA: SDR family oxidoreductase [Chromatiaceae bacterium]|nr:MAG: hypothetical protein N838_03870 [Thiohalocapsa sp. PB-PSB1]QQO52199.1 MAG: SDR family oxidoreductase [Thiohalocapsa sp. PB-PSB1]HBG95603.1 SDR family oxidoreductase [Chromatiaceae bacterium]HCS90159.1 SDR family NAD(P)-dependent oxidoreductase [Chromatiaceae bacterium]